MYIYVCMYVCVCVCMYEHLKSAALKQVDSCAGPRFQISGFRIEDSGNTALDKVDTCAGTPRASVSSIKKKS